MAPVYAAKYSNVPVWVSKLKNVDVMRRQVDGWVNATHLLKVADFDKPRRTRILERDVQTGQHEKVQGGYGKYQGTWIPLDRARSLSEQVGILDIVNDLLEFSSQDGVVAEELPRQPKPASRKNTANGDVSVGSASQSRAKRAKKTNSLPSGPTSVAPSAQQMHTMPAVMDGNGGYGHPQQMQQWHQYPPHSGFTTPTAPGPNGSPFVPGVPMPGISPAGMPQGMPGIPGYPGMFQQNSPYNGQPMMPPHIQQQMQRQASMNQFNHVGPNGSAPHARGKPDQRSPSSSPSLSSSALSSGSDGAFSDDERPYLGGAYRMRNADGHHIDPAAAAAARVRLNGHLSGHPGFPHSGLGGEQQSKQSSNSSLSASSNFQFDTPIVHPNPPTSSGPSQYMADYSSKLLDFFMSSDKTVIPPALLNPQRGPHINQPIDDEGNTAFHWTCAIGRIEVMQALLDAGANIHALNNAGQKPLVRAVLFTNNYEAHTFPKVLEMLSETANFVDGSGRTILHHIANTASSGTRSSSARYYAELLLSKLTASPEIVGDNIAAFVNHQDINGDTALHICGRSNSRRLAKLLLSYNAVPSVPNKAGITPEEIFHREKHNQVNESAHVEEDDSSLFLGSSKAVSTAAKVSRSVAGILSDFAKSYDKDLVNKDNDISQVQGLLNQIRIRIKEGEASIPMLEQETGSEKEVTEITEKLEQEAQDKASQLRHLIERSQSRDLALLVQKEETDVQGELQEQLKRPESIHEEEQYQLADTLTKLQARRAQILDEIIVLYSDSGSREKIKKYRKLLALCCEVHEDEVDGLLDGITQALST